MIIKAIKTAFAVAAIGCLLAVSPATSVIAQNTSGEDHAGHSHDDENEPITLVREFNNPNIKQFAYQYAIGDGTYTGFDQILDAMQPTFKGTIADRTIQYPTNPSLNIAEFDLNGDDIPEIIAVPIETTEDEFCDGGYLRCVHYILDGSKAKMRVLGAIPAFAIDRGDEIKNGYWTLKVFTDSLLPENNPHIDIYAYDKKQKTYLKQQPN